VRTAGAATANGCIADRDGALRELLEAAIDEARRLAAEVSVRPTSYRSETPDRLVFATTR
jgi:hypothetical protein